MAAMDGIPSNLGRIGAARFVTRRCILAGALAAWPALAAARVVRILRVAAASDLQPALDEIAANYRAADRPRVEITYGSSGTLARQIAQGAPFGVFFSADEALVLDLARQGHTVDEGFVYAIGGLVLAVPPASPLKPDGTLADLRAALADGRVKRFAIANPEHAPYGKAAEAALRHAGLWDAIKPKLVLGEHVAQAAQFALSGSAEGGIVALSLSLAPAIAARGRFAPIDPAWHPPLRQRVALTKMRMNEGADFLRHVLSPASAAVLERYGFVRPAG